MKHWICWLVMAEMHNCHHGNSLTFYFTSIDFVVVLFVWYIIKQGCQKIIWIFVNSDWNAYFSLNYDSFKLFSKFKSGWSLQWFFMPTSLHHFMHQISTVIWFFHPVTWFHTSYKILIVNGWVLSFIHSNNFKQRDYTCLDIAVNCKFFVEYCFWIHPF